MQAKVWWRLLDSKLVAFTKKYPEFSETEQVQNILKATAIGVTLSGNILDSSSDEEKGKLIQKLSKLPFIDSNYPEASKEFIEIYLPHLKRYPEVDADIPGWKKKAALLKGINLAKIYQNTMEKDIPALEKILSQADSKTQTTQITVTRRTEVVVSTTTKVTYTLSSTLSENKESAPDITQLPPSELFTHASETVAELKKMLKGTEKFHDEKKQELKNLITKIATNPDDKKAVADLEFKSEEWAILESTKQELIDEIKLFETIIGEKPTIDPQFFKNFVAADRTPRVIGKIIKKITAHEKLPGYEKLDQISKKSIESMLENLLSKTDLEKIIVFGRTEDLVEKLTNEINHAMNNEWSENKLIDSSTFIKAHVPHLLQAIVAEVKGYQQLDMASKKAVENLLIDVLNSKEVQQLIITRQFEQIIKPIAAKTTAALYNKWGYDNGKGIYLKNHGCTAIATAKLFRLIIQPLTPALLKSAIQTSTTSISTTSSRIQ